MFLLLWYIACNMRQSWYARGNYLLFHLIFFRWIDYNLSAKLFLIWRNWLFWWSRLLGKSTCNDCNKKRPFIFVLCRNGLALMVNLAIKTNVSSRFILRLHYFVHHAQKNRQKYAFEIKSHQYLQSQNSWKSIQKQLSYYCIKKEYEQRTEKISNDSVSVSIVIQFPFCHWNDLAKYFPFHLMRAIWFMKSIGFVCGIPTEIWWVNTKGKHLNLRKQRWKA